jgi:7,8-dihydropterin-6-yl-methyl-4-(beta-D-ribofuranosyl)aminobenzene 5'-phosphate synthase
MKATPLDELRILIVVDNETDTLSSVDAGVPQQPELLGHIGRAEKRSIGNHMGCEPFHDLCVACHGFSALLSARSGGQARSLLFDVGPSARVWLDNAARLGVELAAIETVFLSHWHYDHSGALPEVVAAIAQARRARGLAEPSVNVHPDRPDQRGLLMRDGSLVLLPPEPTLAEIETAGGRVDARSEQHLLCGGLFLASGAIPRRTEYETGLSGHHSIRAGVCEPDPLILDERFVAAEVRGRGVTVLSACSHAGVVNASLAAAESFAGSPIDVVLGGFHLAGAAMEQRIESTVRDLVERIRPNVVAPGHCTGWRAKAQLSQAFAPGRYGPSVVGSTYRLEAR